MAIRIKRRPRKVKDYRKRRGKYKTKVGAVWSGGRYKKLGAHKGPVYGRKRGYVKYK